MLGSIASFLFSKVGTAILIIVLLVAGIGIATSPGTIGDPWTEGGEESHKGWTGGVELSDTVYATSWISNGYSESITVQGYGYCPVSIPWSSWDHYRYMVYIEGVLKDQWPSNGWADCPDVTVHGSEKVYFQDWTFNLMGPYVGKLKVEMEGKINGYWPSPDYEGPMGWDGAYLKSGQGEIFLYGDQGPFEIGETANLYVKTGYTGMPAGQGWTVKLYPPADRSDLSTTTLTTIGDDTQKILPVTIASDWFKVGSSNRFRAELWNHLFDVGFTKILTVDFRARAPTEPDLLVTWTGNTASVTASSSSNYTTIDHFLVSVWYGGQTCPSMSDGESWIIFETDYPATSIDGENYSTSFTFNCKNRDGNIVIEVYAYDVDGRGSPPGYYQLIVIDNSFDGGGFDFDQPFLWTPLVILLIVLGILAGVLVAFLLWKAGASPWSILIGFIIPPLILGLIAWYVGGDPGLALLLGYSVWGVI